jgi:uncharacterized protein
VRLSLVPKEQDFFRMFSELGANLDATAQLLVKFMNNDDQEAIAAEIVEHEHAGDKLVHGIIKRLNESFITPIDREDIYQMVANVDDIIDDIDAAVDAMVLYRVGEPTAQARAQATVIAKATALLRICMDSLAKPKGLDEHIIAINSLENEGDRIIRDATAQLFDGHLGPIDVIKWKDVYELLEEAIDECEHAANVIESIVLKHK